MEETPLYVLVRLFVEVPSQMHHEIDQWHILGRLSLFQKRLLQFANVTMYQRLRGEWCVSGRDQD
jgi:hypothetical protein